MSHRLLALVSALTAGDFWLWNWSLSGGRDVLALISGLTLLPLAAASFLLLAVNAARLASLLGRRSAVAVTSQRTGARGRAALRSSREMTSSPVPGWLERRAEPYVPAEANLDTGVLAIEEDAAVDESGVPVGSAAARSPRPARKLAA